MEFIKRMSVFILYQTGSLNSRLLQLEKVTIKFALQQSTKSQRGEQRYSSTFSLTSTLDGGGWSTPRPGRFTPGKEIHYQLYKRLGGPPGPVGTDAENLASPPPEFDPRTVHPVASSYTD